MPTSDSEDLRHRLLDAAEPLFAERGFAGARVRDVTAAAGCNVAAVNYHFGSKEKLYEETFRRRLRRLRDARTERLAEAVLAGASTTRAEELEEVLRRFTGAFLEPLVEGGERSVAMRLLAHEILMPHLPPGMLVEEMIRPVRGMLTGHLRRLFPQLGEDDAIRCVHSVVGQLVHSILAPGVFRGARDDGRPLEGRAQLDHVVRFSAGGVRALAGETP